MDALADMCIPDLTIITTERQTYKAILAGQKLLLFFNFLKLV